MTEAAAAPSIWTLCPFTGGRSWYMKSHFQRSDGFDACSQLRAGIGRVNGTWSAVGVRRPGHALRRSPGARRSSSS